MSENSRREQIIKKIIEELTSISWVSAERIKRVRPTIEELSNYPETLLPLLVVEFSLPVPEEKLSGRSQGSVEKIISVLEGRVFCYIVENENPDGVVSDYADDLFVKLYEDPTKGKLCISLKVIPQAEVAVWAPYVAFCIKCKLKYIHDKGGI